MPDEGKSYKYDVVIASPNSAIDSYYLLDQFQTGKVHRASLAFHTAGGKGNNMARALKNMGGEPLSIGIAGGNSGHFIAKELDKENIPHRLIRNATESRHTITFTSPDMKDSTTILEAGTPVEPEVYDQFADVVFDCHRDAPWLALTGSLPPESPVGLYGDIIRRVKRTGCKVAVDCSGQVLQKAIASGPALIKINREEFCSAFQIPLSRYNTKSIREVYLDYQDFGLEMLIVTDGPNGIISAMPDNKMVHVKTVVPSYVSTAGAGDTFLAGLLLRLKRGDRFPESLKYAAAASVANIQEMVCGFFNPDLIEQYKIKTKIEFLSV